MRAILIAIVFTALAGCASKPVPDAATKWVKPALRPQLETAAPGDAVLIVKRDANVGAALVCPHRISLDEVPLADLMEGEGIRVHAAPGRHIVGMAHTSLPCDNGGSAVAVILDAKDPTVLRSATGPDGKVALTPAVAERLSKTP